MTSVHRATRQRPGRGVGTSRRAFLGVILVAAGCGGEPRSPDRSPTTVGRFDSAGIEVVVSDTTTPAPFVLGEVLLELGGLGGEGPEQFFRVADPRIDAQGRLVVPDGGSSQIRVFDLTGRPLLASGRLGDGPGEFQSIAWARPYGPDSLAVWDDRLERLTILGPDLEVARTVRLRAATDAAPSEAEGPGRIQLGGPATARGPEVARAVDVFGDRSILARIGQISAGPGDTTAVRRDPVRYVRFTPTGTGPDPLVVLPEDETFVWSDGPSRSVLPLAFGRTTHVRAVDGGLAVARNDAFQIRFLDADGREARIATWSVDPPPINEADRAAYRERSIPRNLPPVFARNRERVVEAMPFPDRAPHHGRILPAAEETWLERYHKPDATGDRLWIAFDEHGVAARRLSVPADLRVTQIRGDTLVGVRTSEMDVESIVVATLREAARE